jgi:hypothetical protein
MFGAMQDLKSGYTDMVNNLGAKVTLKREGSADSTAQLFSTKAGDSDEDKIAVNAYGIEVRVGKALATPVLQKFDQLVYADGTIYLIQSVHEIRIAGELIGQSLYMTGDSS